MRFEVPNTDTDRSESTCNSSIFILQDVSATEQLALQIVSYIGCGISVICLAISILYFLFQG